MAHSFAEYANIECPHCGKTFDAPLWLIVDIVEKPELFEALLSNTLHDLTCSHCHQHVGRADVPLLVYHPRASIIHNDFDNIITSILFSSAQQTSEEESSHQALMLITQLRKSLGEKWQDRWIEQGLPNLSRERLRAIVKNFPTPQKGGQTPLRHVRADRAREIIDALIENRPCTWTIRDLDEALLDAYADAYTKAERMGKRIEELGQLQVLRDMLIQGYGNDSCKKQPFHRVV